MIITLIISILFYGFLILIELLVAAFIAAIITLLLSPFILIVSIIFSNPVSHILLICYFGALILIFIILDIYLAIRSINIDINNEYSEYI